MVVAIIIVGVRSIISESARSKHAKEAYDNMIVKSEVERLEAKKGSYMENKVLIDIKPLDGYIIDKTNKGHFMADVVYEDGTNEKLEWSDVDLNTKSILSFDTEKNVSEVTLKYFNGRIITIEQYKDEWKAAEEEAKKKAEEEAKKRQEEEEARKAEIEKNRYEKISDDGFIQKWRIYVEQGKTLQIYGEAGSSLGINVYNESDTLLYTDTVSAGHYEKDYVLSYKYNGYYYVELVYNKYHDYKFNFRVI